MSETVSKNEFLTLLKPMANVSRLIIKNKIMCMDKIKEVLKSRLGDAMIERSFAIEKLDLYREPLQRPRLVCTHSDCTEITAQDSGLAIDYVKHCHDNCLMNDAQFIPVPNKTLDRCEVMSNGTCKACRHGYGDHMHIDYEFIKYMTEVKSDGSGNNVKGAKMRLMKSLKMRMDGYDTELDMLKTFAVQVSSVVKNNTDGQYSDIFLECLAILMKEENSMANFLGDFSSVNLLDEFIKSYIKMVGVEETSVQRPEIHSVLCEEIKSKLIKLEHFGLTFDNLFNFLVPDIVNASTDQSQACSQFANNAPTKENNDTHFSDSDINDINDASTNEDSDDIVDDGSIHGAVAKAVNELKVKNSAEHVPNTSKGQPKPAARSRKQKNDDQDVNDLSEYGSEVPPKDVNILILGETGVGKSTFINGFVNYLTYETLDDALKAPKLVSLIESAFTMTNNATFELIRVKTGSSDNEVHKDGQSATQESKVYCFNVGRNVTVRIIDTPGIGDTRGVDQDNINFQNILDTIGKLDHLNGILILLKPNESRLGVMIKYCIEELLAHLHKTAVRNIVIGFTNTRGTLFRPGDTLPMLQKLLEKEGRVHIPLNRETIYCFDSESFRFLAAKKQGVAFDDDVQEEYTESWIHSVNETKRLIDHVFQCPPHLTQDTTSLNGARKLILGLIKPLADVTHNIEVNKKLCEDKIEELQNTKKKGGALEKILKIEQIDLEMYELDEKRTVCTDSSCTNKIKFDGKEKTDYYRHCHPKCFVKNCDVNTVGHPALRKCYAIDPTSGICNECGHSFLTHMHVVYETKQVTKEIEDKNVRSQINRNKSDVEKVQIVVRELKSRIEEYECEHQIVEKAAAEFACFLKHNAIVPNPDARIEYLNHYLRDEKAKAQLSGDYSLVKSLEDIKRQYLEEFRIIDESIKRGENLQVLSPEHVQMVNEKLLKLKHFGKTIKVVKDVTDNGNMKTFEVVKYDAPKGSWLAKQISSAVQGVSKSVGYVKNKMFNMFS